MFKKDYILIAKVLNKLYRKYNESADNKSKDLLSRRVYMGKADAIFDIVNSLIVIFSADNKRFDKDTFKKACITLED